MLRNIFTALMVCFIFCGCSPVLVYKSVLPISTVKRDRICFKDFNDHRSNLDEIGHQGILPIKTGSNVAFWMKSAFVEELRNSGYELSCKNPYDCEVSGNILAVSFNAYFVQSSNISVAIKVTREEIVIIDRTYETSKEGGLNAWPFSGGATATLQENLREIIKIFLADLENKLSTDK